MTLRMSSSILFVAGLVLLSCGCSSTAPKVARRLLAPEAPKIIASDVKLLKTFGFAENQVAYEIYSLDKKRVVASNNAAAPFVPASVSKIPSTLLALQVLGANYQFKTTLSYQGVIREGKLQGDLYLVGGGDPLLTVAELMDLAQALRRSGITSVRGNFFYDETALINASAIEEKGPEDANYNTGFSALSSEFNRRILHAKSDALTNSLEAYFLPSSGSSLHLDPKVPPDEHLTFKEDGGKEDWTLPSDYSGATLNVPVKQVARYTAQVFRELASSLGSVFPEPIPGKITKTAKKIHTHLSLPLIELVERELEFSNNVMAELIFLSAIKKLNPSLTDRSSAGKALVVWWKTQLRGTDLTSYLAANGSGASSASRMTATQSVAFLKWAEGKTFGGRSYLSLLPISGWKGTMQSRLSHPELAFKVWAKTGSMDYASALSGYLFSDRGERFIFTVFVGDTALRAARDQVGYASSEGELKAEKWLSKARGLQDALLVRWIKQAEPPALEGKRLSRTIRRR